jgi:hypothetical protein
MLHAKHLPYHFWAEAMNTACHVHNRVTLRTGTATTLYELWKERKPTVKYFHALERKDAGAEVKDVVSEKEAEDEEDSDNEVEKADHQGEEEASGSSSEAEE